MSQLLIQQYLNQLSVLKKVSGTSRESVVREAFKDLLKGMGRSHDLTFVPEYEIETKLKRGYRFADYKEKVVDLLMRVTTVSVETQRITDAMKSAAR